eukprot:jgi/Tetstr1/444089/TSEL_003326.t1
MPSSETLAGRDIMTGVVTWCSPRPIHHRKGPRAGLRQNLFDDPLWWSYVLSQARPSPVLSAPARSAHLAATRGDKGARPASCCPHFPQVAGARFMGREDRTAPQRTRG